MYSTKNKSAFNYSQSLLKGITPAVAAKWLQIVIPNT